MMARGKPFQPGADPRRNTKTGPYKSNKTVARALATITPEDVEKIAGQMKVLALAGDPAAASAVAAFVAAGVKTA
jgi:hypothetical protein